MVTPAAPPEKVAGLTFGTITPEQRTRERDDYGFWEIAHSIVILAIIAGVYIAFW
jgi:solute:Na+ symporter, SSS family